MSRKYKREENASHESEPKKKIVIKLPEFKGFTKKQILIGLMIVLVLVLILILMNRAELGIVFNKNITDDDVIQVDLIGANNKMYSYYNEVLIANADGICTYNRYGRKTWELDMTSAVDCDINTSGRYLQIINSDKSKIYIYNDKYETAQIRVDGTVLSGTINSKGDSVIEHTTSGNKTILTVYDKNGRAKYNVKVSNNTIGKYILSDDSKYLAYVDVNIKGISVSSKIQLIEFKGKKDAIIKDVIDETNALIYDIEFDGNNLIYRSERNVGNYNIITEKLKSTSVSDNEITFLDIDGRKYSYVTSKKTGYYLGIRKVGTELEKEIPIEEQPRYYIYDNGKIYVCYQKKMCIYNNAKIKIKEYQSNTVITKPVTMNSGHDIAFLVSNKLIIYTI